MDSHSSGGLKGLRVCRASLRVFLPLSAGVLTACGSFAPTLELTPQTSGTTALLQAVSPVDARVVWVSGHDGTYARTLDGGETWSAAVMAGEEVLQFRDVEAIDAGPRQ